MTTREEVINRINIKLLPLEIEMEWIELIADWHISEITKVKEEYEKWEVLEAKKWQEKITAAEKRARVEVAREILDHRYSGDVGIKGPYRDYSMKCNEIIAANTDVSPVSSSEPAQEGK